MLTDFFIIPVADPLKEVVAYWIEDRKPDRAEVNVHADSLTLHLRVTRADIYTALLITEIVL